MDVIVIGGGVIGLGVAWQLAQAGVRVRLLMRGQVGDGTTSAAAGILPPARWDTACDAIDRLRGQSHQLFPAWSDAIRSATGIDIGLRQCGGIYLAEKPGEAAALAGAVEYWHDYGITAERLSADQLVARVPQLESWAKSPRFRTAVWVPDEWQVRPPDLLRGLAAACVAAGVEMVEGVAVGLRRRGDRAIIESASGDLAGVPAGAKIVLCGGVWTGQIAERFGLGLSLVPIRGQMLLYRLNRRPFASVINEGQRYLVPRDDGCLLVGSCEEEVGFEAGTTAEMLAMLQTWAVGVFPELSEVSPIDRWSALRPATFDGFPIIGRMPEVENLWIAAGHFRSGVHLAPATAKLVAALIRNEPPEVDPAAFAVGRLLTRQPHGTTP